MERKKEIEIVVGGSVGSGKTAVAQMIKELIEMYGGEVVVEDTSGGHFDQDIFRNYAALQHLCKNGLKVRIRTNRTYRDGYADRDLWEYQRLMMQSMIIPKKYFTDMQSIALEEEPKDEG